VLSSASFLSAVAGNCLFSALLQANVCRNSMCTASPMQWVKPTDADDTYVQIKFVRTCINYLTTTVIVGH
jgi:hypothetical protein